MPNTALASAAAISPTVAATRSVYPLRILSRFAIAVLVVWTVSRFAIALYFADRVESAHGFPTVFLLGMRADLITLGWALAIPVLLLPVTCFTRGLRVWLSGTRMLFTAVLTGVIVLEITSTPFLVEYQVRPNRLALDYLGRPQEVMPMLWGGFRIWLFAGLAGLAAGAWTAWRFLAPATTTQPYRWTQLWRWLVLIVLCVLMIRSSFDHRPANPSTFARWDDTLVNQLALNGAYTLGYAIYALRHEADVDDLYGKLDERELIAMLRERPEFAMSPSDQPTQRTWAPVATRDKPLNLIIIVQESMGAGFSHKLSGGENDTPQLDRWSDRGWWFENLYATGTRSARGLEAIVAGFPPSPAQSVLKRQRAQRDFATLAGVLREQGYFSEFIYGGESHFDNMRGFFLGNGFNSVIDQDDYAEPVFKGSWGVSDEDLFTRAQARVTELHARGKPFFTLVFTSSNHTPFEYPADRITPDGDPHSARNAVRYADYATGQFLDQASRSAYFKDTLILVVADHDVRVYGDDIVPLQRFRIPGLLIGADVQPRVVKGIASQIDLAPTLLSLMGVRATAPFPGRDLNRSLPEFGGQDRPRALMQFNDNFARYEDDVLSVLVPGGEARQYRVDPRTRALSPMPTPTDDQRRRLLAEVQLPAWLYDNDAYRLPAPQ